MNKLFILAALTALVKSSQAAVITVTANQVTVTANSGATPTPAAAPIAQNPIFPVASAGSSGSSSNSVSSSSASSSSSGSGSLNVTQEEFLKAFNEAKPYFSDPNVGNPTEAQYKAFINNAGPKGGITSKTELAMFLAEILWESGGLIYKSEVACKENNCAGTYSTPNDVPGKYYFGRGYMQLTWEYNYSAASKDLYGDDRLRTNPEMVATDEDVAWGVSFWFWKTVVKPKLNGTYNFGLATDAINGGKECRGADPTKAKKRYAIYVALLKVFEPSATPVESGCYN